MEIDGQGRRKSDWLTYGQVLLAAKDIWKGQAAEAGSHDGAAERLAPCSDAF